MFSKFLPPKTVPFMCFLGKFCRVGQATGNNIIPRMHFACWITKAGDKYSEYEILIAVPRPQWLR